MKIDDITPDPSQEVHAPKAIAPQALVRSFSGAGLEKMQDFSDSMLDLEHALEDIKSFGGPEAQKKADKLIKSVHKFEPSLTMIGQIKSGKTSLVNAMAGLPELLPADVNPWTSVVTSLHLNTPLSDKAPVASFQLFDQHEWDHLVEKGGRLGELSSRAGADDELEKVRDQINKVREKTKTRLGKKFELLLGQTHNYQHLDDALMQRYVCMGDEFGDPQMQDAQGQFADITKSADLYLSAPALPMPLCIRDTPGVNDTFMMREQITINALRSSRICVVVLSATQALSSTDMGLIRLISNVQSREVVIFVNRIDELANPAQEIKEIEASIHATLAANHGPSDLKVVFGSAYWANMALTGKLDEIVPDSVAALQRYAVEGHKGIEVLDSATVWNLSGVPALYDAISLRIADGQGAEMMRAVRRRALNHLQGLKASSSIVSLRLDMSDLEMVDTAVLLNSLTDTEGRMLGALENELTEIFAAYEARVDQAHKRFLDRALESLLDHLETNGEEELWQYSPDGLRVLLRSSYHMMRKKAEKACARVFGSAAATLSDIYLNMLSIQVDGFQITPPEAPAFPPPATLGQTIALDLQSSWWKGWWQRRKGFRSYADEFYKLIEAETEPMINDMRVTQTQDIRRIAIAELSDFLAEQRGILTDVNMKTQISPSELRGLFGITAQQERDELFEILTEEFTVDEPAETDVTNERPARPARPRRPAA